MKIPKYYKIDPDLVKRLDRDKKHFDRKEIYLVEKALDKYLRPLPKK